MPMGNQMGGMQKRKRMRRPVGMYRPPENLDYALTKRNDQIDYGLDSYSGMMTMAKRKRKEDRFRNNYRPV